MNFIDAISTGKKIRCENWNKNFHIDTSIFKESKDDLFMQITKSSGNSISYYDLFSNWEIVE